MPIPTIDRTHPAETTRPSASTSTSTSVVNFAEAVRSVTDGDGATPAGLTERLLPEVRGAFWLRVVSIALDVDWQPGTWGLLEGAAPTPEVMRRFRPLAQAAQLIRCSAEEAESFFSSDDPGMIHSQMAQKPAVLVRQRDGALAWCIGGHQGRIAPELLRGEGGFLAHLLENLCDHPDLLGNAGPGIDAIADPDGPGSRGMSTLGT